MNPPLILDTLEVYERRNPLSKADLKKKKKELENVIDKKPDQVYALAIGSIEDPIYFYVGVSVDPIVRYAAHLRGIANPIDIKDAYEWVRYHKQRDTLHLTILDAEGEFTEEEWRLQLLELGHPLQNSTSGNDIKRKVRVVDPNIEALHGVEEYTGLSDRCALILKDMHTRTADRIQAWADKTYSESRIKNMNDSETHRKAQLLKESYK